MEGYVVRSEGVGILGILTVLFIALKLMGYITWSWWWVLAPLWLPSFVCLVLALFFFGLAVIMEGR